MIRFIEVINDTIFDSRRERTALPSFKLGEVWINEEHISHMRAAPEYKRLLDEGQLAKDLNPSHHFTSVTIASGTATTTHIVVGEINSVAKRLGYDTRTLLKG
jgi:hypothetical protein